MDTEQFTSKDEFTEDGTLFYMSKCINHAYIFYLFLHMNNYQGSIMGFLCKLKS